MPNHVTTVITMSPKAALALTRESTEEERNDSWQPAGERVVDFSQVIPEPENIERGNCSGRHEPGEVCWFGWNRRAWGTKWNAYDSSVEPISGDLAEVRFDTAWSHPTPVVTKLSQMFSDEEFHVKYADEDTGYNLGDYVMVNGKTTEDHSPAEGTLAATKFAYKLKYGVEFNRDYLIKVWGVSEEEADNWLLEHS